MSNKYTIAILGGDRRQAVIAKELYAKGHTVKTFGLDSLAAEIYGTELCSTPEKAIKDSDCIILPLPASRDGKTLNLSSGEKLAVTELEKIVHLAYRNGIKVIVGGMIPKNIISLGLEKGIEITDFYEIEELQQLNALPSAEGAISLAMQNSEKVLEGMKVLVTGYGRIGKILSKKLKALGASVSVAARRDEILCEIAMSGYNAVRITDEKDLKKTLLESEIIFNTVPEIVFSRTVLPESLKETIYIEIASSPGGIDVPCARERNMKIYFAPSLPGKYAPISAGEYIFEAITKILRKRGIEI